jgi:hypothetical protein
MQEFLLAGPAVDEFDLVGERKRSLPFVVVEAQIRDDHVKPRGEFGFLALIPQLRSFPEFEKRRLDEILGIVSIFNKSVCHAVKASGVTMDHGREGSVIPVLYLAEARFIVTL